MRALKLWLWLHVSHYLVLGVDYAILVGLLYRGIAQSGSAPALGAGCREFESLYPDQFFESSKDFPIHKAPVAQLDRASAF